MYGHVVNAELLLLPASQMVLQWLRRTRGADGLQGAARSGSVTETHLARHPASLPEKAASGMSQGRLISRETQSLS